MQGLPSQVASRALRLLLFLAVITASATGLANVLYPASASAQEAWTAPAPQTTGAADSPAFVLKNFHLSGNETLLTARLSVSISNLDYLRDILRDGARLSIECRSAIYRKRTLWRNALIEEHNFSSSLRYNPLQRDFLLFSENGASLTNSDLLALLQNTWGNLEMPLTQLSSLENGETYVVLVSLALKHEEMPPWLSKNVLFWSDIIIPAQEYKLEFEY